MNLYLLSMWCLILSLVMEVTNPSTAFVRDQFSNISRTITKHDGNLQKNHMKKFSAEQHEKAYTQKSVESTDDDLMGESVLYVLLVTPVGLIDTQKFLRPFVLAKVYKFNLRPVLNKPPVGWT